MRKPRTSKRISLESLLPKRRRERRRVELLGGVSAALFGILIVGIFFASGLQQFALRSPSIAAVISAILVDLANGDRSSDGLSTLSLNPKLVAVAQAKANDMAAKGYFAHISPEGVDPWHWFEEIGYDYSFAGENLAVDFSDSSDVERAWMHSPTHRDNILNSKFTEIGIATAEGIYQGHVTTFVVQSFGAPSDVEIRLNEREEEIVPEDPTETAIAIAPPSEDDVQVLGSSAEVGISETVSPMIEPNVAAALAKEVSGDVPLWGYVVGFPKNTLKYVYYLLGFFVLLALAVETGFEIRSHHRKKAIRAGLLLVTMALLFIVADYAFFVEPVLAQAF